MIAIDAFVSPDTIDPIYLSGTVYYLVPEGKVGEHPFNLIREGMLTENRYAVAKVVLHTREHVVLLWPAGSLLAMHVLDYDVQAKKPGEFEDMVPKVDLDPEEIEMAKTLIESKSAHFDPSQYKDHSTEKLKELVEAKVAGKEIVAAPAVEHAQVLNLMDALKASVAMQAGSKQTEDRPPKKVAPSTPEPKAEKKSRRKSS
jgi:DNA end-binding protein Ku